MSILIPRVLASSNPGLKLANAFGVFLTRRPTAIAGGTDPIHVILDLRQDDVARDARGVNKLGETLQVSPYVAGESNHHSSISKVSI